MTGNDLEDRNDDGHGESAQWHIKLPPQDFHGIKTSRSAHDSRASPAIRAVAVTKQLPSLAPQQLIHGILSLRPCSRRLLSTSSTRLVSVDAAPARQEPRDRRMWRPSLGRFSATGATRNATQRWYTLVKRRWPSCAPPTPGLLRSSDVRRATRDARLVSSQEGWLAAQRLRRRGKRGERGD